MQRVIAPARMARDVQQHYCSLRCLVSGDLQMQITVHTSAGREVMLLFATSNSSSSPTFKLAAGELMPSLCAFPLAHMKAA